MTDLDQLKEAAYERVAHMLPNHIFNEFDQLNSRMLIAVTLMQRGEKNLAYRLFETIAENGPDENENRLFAYVRSLTEMAEMDAEREAFDQAEKKMETALHYFPESMGYMMSRVHLEVYLTYYRFQLGHKERAICELKEIVDREEAKFRSQTDEDGRNLVGPGLCYALHQLALFYAEKEGWKKAVENFRLLKKYASSIDEKGWEKALQLEKEGLYEEAFRQMEESVSYQAG
ncbi:hypothetical protein [Melghirimyces algeriensis]|uniref:Tetratricopeptide repeat-containing protein n=1 Tax=Melghirimyces algeriensis TaxID=910412 RepID=A0A521DFH7_9BACL|nr:hypothetical protein [Melghirimyces algeriensis]SMO70554.1 hypothetical protein SAMN06264849_10636 [Melghirimyces algeriensis]